MVAPYIITGESSISNARPIAHARASEIEAVTLAQALIGKGMKSVRIIDAVGCIYTAANFHQLFPAEQNVECSVAPKTGSARKIP